MKRPSRGTSTRYRLVGGKGGVGKTTCAAARAVDVARRGSRTLVISTDPAPSLGDVLGIRLAGSPRPVPNVRGTLHALEVSPHRALERWLRPRRGVLETIALRGTWLDETDVGELLLQSLPGIDELAALLEILRHGRSPRYDVIVVDTAPTGHTLRMLSMPETLSAVARVFDHMQAKHRTMVEALRGVAVEDAADRMIRGLQADADALVELLRDPDLTEVSLVALPERIAVEETLDATRSLMRMQVPVAEVVLNRVTARPPGTCGWCDARRSIERDAMATLAADLESAASACGKPVPRLRAVSARTTEPVGVRALGGIAADLRRIGPIPRRVGAPRARVVTRESALPDAYREAAAIEPVRLLMFGGKGGVGKTTCAAATALRLAEAHPRRRFLLVSADPAHSLADVLNTQVSDAPRRLAMPRNLHVREIDAARALERIRRRYRAAVDGMFERLIRGSAIDATHDRIVMRDLVEFAPPGLDELAAVLELVGLLGEDASRQAYDVVVLDTAPTGHALRLLEMPEAVQDWAKMLMRILLKYRTVAGLGDLGAALLQLSRGLGGLRSLLADPAEARLVVVTRAAALPRAETARLLGALRRLRIQVPAMVVNAVGAGGCTRCRATARHERRELELLGELAAASSEAMAVIAAPAMVPPPEGIPALEDWSRRWRVR